MAGLIAFFDVLGYQSFLENNSARESALQTLKLIKELPGLVEKQLIEQWMKHEAGRGEMAVEVSKACKPLIFSDTIVLSIEYPEHAEEIWKFTALGYLTIYAANLFCGMFASGLPMRGVIGEGEFIFVDACLAGRAVVEAYKLCNSLDLAGLVVQDSFKDRVPKLFLPPDGPKFFVWHKTPVDHSKNERQFIHLNWLGFFKPEDRQRIQADIETVVFRSFSGHKKDCSLAVNSKIQNTVKLLRYLSLALDHPDSVLSAASA